VPNEFVRSAALQAAPTSRRGLLERLFARLFEGLVYAQIWEDPEVDMAALELGPADRVVAIASGGCNVMSYLTADPARVLAVDLNPAHLALLELKLKAARHLNDGAAFRRLFAGPGTATTSPRTRRWRRRSARPRAAGGRAATASAAAGPACFGGTSTPTACSAARSSSATSPAACTAATRAGWSPRPRRRSSAGCSRPSWRRCSAVRWCAGSCGCRWPTSGWASRRPSSTPCAPTRGGDLAALVRGRVERLACDFPIGDNWFAWQAFARRYPEDGPALPPYLRPGSYAAVHARADRVECHQAAVTDLLARQDAASLDAYVLLDAQDWMGPAQVAALWAQVNRTARPGARVIFRTAAADSPLPAVLPPDLLRPWRYEAERSRGLHARDRSAVYGGFHLYRLAAVA
jgi:S-adenosylmethionine-diacylglycerol 3-amino-3-carboxypropyl transferase